MISSRLGSALAGLLLVFPAITFSADTATAADSNTAVATFAGGCFWCMEPPYDRIDGVLSTVSGYMGGDLENPTYKQVSSGRSGHIETVQITYDPGKVTYDTLLEVFWKNIDPTDPHGQFCDKGSQYRSAIFTHNTEQREKAEASKRRLQQSKPFDGDIVTEIIDATRFYPAEDYHQDYYMKNPLRYKYYRFGCGRDARLESLWGE